MNVSPTPSRIPLAAPPAAPSAPSARPAPAAEPPSPSPAPVVDTLTFPSPPASEPRLAPSSPSPEPPPARTPLAIAGDIALGALAGAVIETLYNTAAVMYALPDTARLAVQVVQQSADFGPATRAVLTAAVPVAAVAVPVATAAGSVVYGAARGIDHGAQEGWREAVLWAFGDAIRFSPLADRPYEYLHRALEKTPPPAPPTPQPPLPQA